MHVAPARSASIVLAHRRCIDFQEARVRMQTAAMVTAERAMKGAFFPGIAFPFETAGVLYRRLGRAEEARDTARLALKQPWWTVSDLSRSATAAILP